ncbi:hypothetical protein BC830DRAFT_1159475, partial [Chytriomyces sp. MP71]
MLLRTWATLLSLSSLSLSSLSLRRSPQTALATAQILLVRFFAVAPSSEFAVADIALACVLLACKVEEVGRRVADVVNVYFALKVPSRLFRRTLICQSCSQL